MRRPFFMENAMALKLIMQTDMPYFHKGYDRQDYTAGQVVETEDEEFAEVAIREGWATTEEAAEKAPKGKKASAGAPENKAA